MKKLLLAVTLGFAFCTSAFTQEKDVSNLYVFQIKSGNKVLTEFEQNISYVDIDNSDFSYQHKTKYYKDCRSENSETFEVDEGAQGVISFDPEIDIEMLHMSFDVNSSRKIGLCQEPKMENFEISIGFPFLSTERTVTGTLGNEYTVQAGKVRVDNKTGKIVYPKFN